MDMVTQYLTMDDVTTTGLPNTTNQYESGNIGFNVYISDTILMFLTTLAINLAMGCTLDPIDLKRQWNTLGGTLAGCLSQFLIYPALTYLVSHIVALPASSSIGLALLASCPGSALTSMVTYYIDGDVCLSLCLTVVCSAVSIGFTPAMVHIYSRSWTHKTLHVALWPMASSLFLHVVPPIIGYVINLKMKKIAKVLKMICIVIGLLSFNSNCIMQIIANASHMSEITFNMVLLTLLLPLMGWGLANLLAWLFRQSIRKRRTIGVEVLLHNVPLALVIIGTAFHNFDKKEEVSAGLALNIPVIELYGVLVVFFYYLLHKTNSEAVGRMPRAEPDLPELSGNGAVGSEGGAPDWAAVVLANLNMQTMSGRGKETSHK
ncbi:solute carrier family 10 member 6-like [Asterias rubens]|uniref:solute carrier family 10 member 6-like n=1 Tax=Asterias rubens TaxID=7604 RepID=UPI00145520AC|nr:solute carrier family 10 member 6-like [Asterias rubens]